MLKQYAVPGALGFYGFNTFIWFMLALLAANDPTNTSVFKQPGIFCCLIIAASQIYLALDEYFKENWLN